MYRSTLFAAATLALMLCAEEPEMVVKDLAMEIEPARNVWPRPAMLVRELPAEPNVGGEIDQALWAKCESHALEYEICSMTRIASDARFRTGYREGTLFLLIELDWRGDMPPKLDAKAHDGDVWADDGFELFFAPAGDWTQLRQLLFNLAGVQGDVAAVFNPLTGKTDRTNAAWNPEWKVQCVRKDHAYVAQVAVPLDALGINARAGEVFRFDLVRNRHNAAALHWSAIKVPRNQRPDYFGFAALGPAAAAEFNADQLRMLGDVLVPGDRPKACLTGQVATVLCDRPFDALGPKPVKLTATLKDGAGKVVDKQTAEPRWPCQVSVRSAADRALRLELSVGDKSLGAFPLRWQEWVFLDASDLNACPKTGRGGTIAYPRTISAMAYGLFLNSTVTVKASVRAIYLRFPAFFLSPGPYYGSFMNSKMSWRIDDGPAREISPAALAREVPLTEDLPEGEHTLVLKGVAGACMLEGVRLARAPLSCVQGIIATDDSAELLTDVRAEVLTGGEVTRMEFARAPHNGRFEIYGLKAGKCQLLLTAAGWKPCSLDVTLPSAGAKVDLGVITLSRDESVREANACGPAFGRSVSVQPGNSFTAALDLWGPLKQAELVSAFKTIPLRIEKIEARDFGRWNSNALVTLGIPAGAARDLYALRLKFAGGERTFSRLTGQAVCVRAPLPERFFLAGFGHMNVWGQETAEYLRKVAEVAQLGGARLLLIANEVNAAYISGTLASLRIPYAVSAGNHTMGRWENFFRHTTASDDGPMRIVTHSALPFESWALADELFRARPETTCRVLLCYEGLAPIDFITTHKPAVIFDAHSDDPHPALKQFPQGTLHFRAPTQDTLRWIPMTPRGLAEEVRAPSDIPILTVPRDDPAPLRVEFSSPNDGSAGRMAAAVVNDCEIPFSAGNLRLVLKAGAYRVQNAEVEQTFNSDDGQRTILDLRLNIKPKSRLEITAEAE